MLTVQQGIMFPPQMNNKGDLAQVEGAALDESNVGLIIGIDRGEIEWDGNMGTRLRQIKHTHNSNNEIIKAIAQREATEQINAYLPHLRAQTASVSSVGPKTNISIDYTRRDTLGTVTSGTAQIEV